MTNFSLDPISFGLACSRLSVVGDERKRARKKKRGRTKPRNSERHFYFSTPFLHLVKPKDGRKRAVKDIFLQALSLPFQPRLSPPSFFSLALFSLVSYYLVSFAAVNRVVTQRSSPLTAAHSSCAFLSLCY